MPRQRMSEKIWWRFQCEVLLTQLFEEKKNETFLRSVSVSNEVFYTRAQ